MKHIALLFLVITFAGCNDPNIDPIPNPLPTVEVSPTPPPTPAPTPEPSPTPTPTPTPSPSPSPSPTPPAPTDHAYIGPAELQPYVNTFVDLGAVYGRDLDVSKITLQFGELTQYGSGVIGLCETGYGSDPVVTLKGSWWSTVSTAQRTLLVLHELGHCSLYRDHRTTVDSNGVPVSIMYPIILTTSVYNANKTAYDTELYTFEGLSVGNATHICTPSDLGL